MRSSGEDRPRLRLNPAGRERLRFGKSGAPYLVPLAVAGLAAALLWFSWDRVASLGAVSLASPDTQVREALANQRRALLNDVYGFKAGGTAELYPLSFGNVAVEVSGQEARVVAMLDAEGRVKWRDQQASLQYRGRERFRMHPCRIALWCGEGDQFEQLRGVLQALFRRHDASAQGDAAAQARLVSPEYRDGAEDRDAVTVRLARQLAARPRPAERIVGWQIRVERDRAEVGEEYELDGRTGGGGKPFRARYTLGWDGNRWAFLSGL